MAILVTSHRNGIVFSSQRLQPQLLNRRNHGQMRRSRTVLCSAQTPQTKPEVDESRRPARPGMLSTKELTRKDRADGASTSKRRNEKRNMSNAHLVVNGRQSPLGKGIAGRSVGRWVKPKKGSGEEAEMEVLSVDENFEWSKESYSSWQRSIDIWAFLLVFRLRIAYDSEKWTYFNGFSEDTQRARRRRTASWLREQALHLGPTFIKFGQFFSTRSDLLPKEYVDELAKLQDKVPAFSHEKARHCIETELGAPIAVLFKKFQDRPIAAASLGQVHQAILHNGENVVIKVQRPGLKKLFDIDLRNMKLLAEYFQHREVREGSKRNWLAIYNDCSRLLYQEIDYICEGKNADRFRRDFRNIRWVRIPLVYWDYTSTKVLTLEYVPGVKISDLDALESKGYSRSRIASSAIESYLIQILKTGFIHADPHPGNVAIDADGSLVYYDFGMMGEVKSFTRERLLELFFAVYENDVKKVARCLIALDIVQPTGDIISLQQSIRFFLTKLTTQTTDREQTLAAIGEDLFSTARDQPISFPSTFVYVLKAFTTIEGIGYALDPQFSFAKCAAPYIEELVNTRQKQIGPELIDNMRRQADDARSHALSVPYRIQQIDDFTKQLESGDLKLRVRVLESEKAARKAMMLQMATIHLVLGGILLNTGITLSSQGIKAIATGFFIGFGIFLTMSVDYIKRMQKLDKFDKIQ